jgi:hypothetical protein
VERSREIPLTIIRFYRAHVARPAHAAAQN